MKLLPVEHVDLDREADNGDSQVEIEIGGMRIHCSREHMEWMQTEGKHFTMVQAKKPKQEQGKNGHNTPKRRAGTQSGAQRTRNSSVVRASSHPISHRRSRTGDGIGKGGYRFTAQDQAKGGKARAKILTPAQRRASAKKAIAARWAKHRGKG
jgi:hypothetical protein